MNNNKKINSSFLIYGHHPVLAALKNKNRIKKNLYITQKYAAEFDNYASLVKINIISRDEFRKLFKENTLHQEIALEVAALSYDISEIISSSNERSLIIILDQVQDPHNIGAILRTAAAFDAKAVINTIHCSPGETGIIAKTACGGLDIVPYVSVTNISKTIELLQKHNYWIYGLDGSAKGNLPTDLPNKTVFVLGSEESGMRKLVRESCDLLCKIPMGGNMESLNVSNAAAIAMYHFENYQS